MNVAIVDSDAKTITDELGISDERSEFLIKKLGAAKGNTPAQRVADVSRYCKHPNELAFVALGEGGYTQAQIQKQELGELLQRLLTGNK